MGSTINLYEHQQRTLQKGLALPALLDASDPGTGKTIANLAVFDVRKQENRKRRLLVLCPKSIMVLAWGRDIQRAFPHLTYSCADATRREAAFMARTDIVIMNHDGVTWLKHNLDMLDKFTDLIIDESTAFKNRTADRSKNIRAIVEKHPWEHKTLLTGTPMPLTVCDLWHQMLLLDGGQRLGKNFFAFQSACCTSTGTGPGGIYKKWQDKPGIADVVMHLVEDITVRHTLEACIDIPPNNVYTLATTLNSKHRAQYEELKRKAVLELESGTVDAFHAGALRTKLLQLLSGAVYDGAGNYHQIDSDRYNLVLDLVEQRKASLVAFNWAHQREEIMRLANNRGLCYGVIDGETSRLDRVRIVDAFQAGELQFILGHPATMAHGITLTYGVATIWPSPTDNAEHFVQMNRRVYRNGQTARTETILIAAESTLEEAVYDRLMGKVSRQADLLELLATIDNSPETAQSPPTHEVPTT